MKKKIRKVFLFSIMIMICISVVGEQVRAEQVERVKISEQFPDVVLQEVVRKLVGARSVNDMVAVSKFTDVNDLVYSRPSSTKITSLEGIGIFSNLMNLDLVGNNIEYIPDEIRELVHLERLDLHNNQLQNIPEIIGNLTSLRYFYIENNQLTNIPDTVCNLKELSDVNWSGNKLTKLPEEIGNLKELEYLYLHNNQIESIPSSISDLDNLKNLLIGNNQLTSIPDSIGTLSSLAKLRLQNNKLTSLPNNLFERDNPLEIYVNNNALSDVTLEQITDAGYKLENFTNQIYTLDKKGVMGYSFRIDMSAFMKSCKDDYPDNTVVKLRQHTKELGETKNEIEDQFVTLDKNVLNFENGEITIPKENLQMDGQYEISIEVNEKPWFTYKFEIEQLDLSFSRLPDEVYVGDTFTLVPSINDQEDGMGWEWDANTFDVSFLSSATFTAKKAGITQIKYVTLDGYIIQTELEVKENNFQLDFDSNGGIGNMESILCTFEEETTLPKNEFSREDYTFEGWALSREDASKKNISFLNEGLYKLQAKEATTLYAVWSAVEIQLEGLAENVFVGDDFTLVANVMGTWSYDATMLEIIESNEKSTIFRALKAGDAVLTLHAANGKELQLNINVKEVEKVPETGDVQNVTQLFGMLILSLLGISFKLKKTSK